MYDLITIGDCMIDAFHVLEDHEIDVLCSMDTKECQLCMTYADKIPIKELHKLVAGNAANNVVGASRLGLRTAIYTVVGDDMAGQLIREKLQEEGVALDYLICQRGAESNYSTVLSFKGERTILVYHSERQFRLPSMDRAEWLYYTSMTKAGHAAIIDNLLRYHTEQGSKLIYQPGTFQLRLGAEPVKALLEGTHLIIMNKEEAQGYCQLPHGSIAELLVALTSLGPRIAVVTDGAAGSSAMQEQTMWSLGTRPEIPRKESTGAGDAYATGLTTALMLGHDLPEAMRWGTLNAEGVIQQIGPQAGLLTREAMEHQLSKYPEFKARRL